MDVEQVVETGGHEIAAERLEDERFDPVVAQPLIAAGERTEIFDSRDFEPDGVGRVMRDPLCVGVGEAHAGLRREREAFHPAQLYDGVVTVERLVRLVLDRRPASCSPAPGEHRVRHSRLPLSDGHLGEYDPMEVRDDRCVSRRPGEGLGLLREAARHA